MIKYVVLLFLLIMIIIVLKYNDCEKYKKQYNSIQYMQTNYNLNYNFKNIFCFWNSKIIPPLINECVKNYKIKLPEWNIILLNDKTIYNFIDKTDFPNNYNKLEVTQKSDWIRLFLLYKYGGLWMDASIIINDPSEINYMYDKVFKENYEIAGYSFSNKLYSFEDYYTFENWFIISRKNSEIIYKWLKEYEYAIEIGFESYNNNNNLILTLHVFTNYFNDNYWIVYTCFQNTILKNKILYDKIFIKDCRETMFHYHYYTCSIPYFNIILILFGNNEKNIKLINTDRKTINELFLEDVINKYF